ncbi:serine palmitoyltransferase component [Tilletia horrida]|uniref:serine C-palmitoyltransferase n=1 Tax=Tilletia horrida TaxID=155126 RepID=A0AAN6JPE0_9BASI|nr:serine palmitoyltransferase component [Tilletia horrida]KAK0544644.1 serine palmitoyltransferase component [Tilletia horrida]
MGGTAGTALPPPAWADPALSWLGSALHSLSLLFEAIPGSQVVARYVASSYQNDPFRSLLELALLAFAVRTLLASRTRGSGSTSNFVKLSEREIDDLVDDWNPDPLCAPLSQAESDELESVPMIVGPVSAHPTVSTASLNDGKPTQVLNLASYNFTDLAGQPDIKQKAIETMREYGVGTCSPPGFYGTIDVHVNLESELANFINTEDAIIYSQAFSTAPSVISAFAKRGDYIVADKGCNFAVQLGIQVSRSTTRWYEHNNLLSLEQTLDSVRREAKRRGGRLTRRFIVTEGIFERDGAKVDLAKIVELAKKYKFRIILDESLSIGTVGKTGRGMTELCGVPASDVSIIIGSMANTFGSAGGFCAGSKDVVYHQRINAAGFVFSAALPALLAVAASTALQKLIDQPQVLDVLQSHIRTMRGTLDHVQSLHIPSDPISPLIHVQIRSASERHPDSPYDPNAPGARSSQETITGASTSSSAVAAAQHAAVSRLRGYSRSGSKSKLSSSSSSASSSSSSSLLAQKVPNSSVADTHDLSASEQIRLLQLIVDDALQRGGVLLVRTKKLPSVAFGSVVDMGSGARPSIRIALSAALSADEVARAAEAIKASAIKVLGERR